jgi:RNA polymerase primary sigma factor
MMENNNEKKNMDQTNEKPSVEVIKERLNKLIEDGKKKGMLSSKELMDVLEELNLEQEQIDRFYDTLEKLEIDITEDDALAVLPVDDVAPELEDLEDIEEITKEELVDTDP